MEGYNPKDRNFETTDQDSNKIGGNVGDVEMKRTRVVPKKRHQDHPKKK